MNLREKRTRLNLSQYKFDTFVVSDKNRVAHAACVSVASSEKPSDTFNPIFIYGAHGSGKTHLVYSMADILTRSQKKVLYFKDMVSGEIARAISKQEDTAEYLLKYKCSIKEAEVLILEDIQELTGKLKIQETIIKALDSLDVEKVQIIVTADRLPNKLDVDGRLIKRLTGGLVVGI